jgi:hypothetical protein
MFKLSAALRCALVLLAVPAASAQCVLYQQGFEVDTDGWNIFTSPTFDIVRVPSGTNGVTSADGAWHAEGVPPSAPAGNWGGYAEVCGCSSTGCATGAFPAGGYRTSIDIWLDVDGGWANDSRFDFSSAINNTAGAHRRDFIFNGAFLDSGDLTPPMGGVNRFVLAASNNSPGFPQGGVDPVAITTSGWYTLQHRFYDLGSGQLACDFTVLDADGVILAVWTRSDASDIIGVTVGGNRYGWLLTNEFPFLALDNARRQSGAETGSLVLSAPDCPADASPAPGYQVALSLDMTLDGTAMGFAAFVEYDMGTLAYRGDLSSYTLSPFPAHITGILQADDGLLSLDGSSGFGDPGTAQDALLATLVFDVLAECGTDVPASFEVGGFFPSELSNQGLPLPTTLVDADPITLDGTDPLLIGCPGDMTQPSDAGCTGAVVTYTDPTATDNCDPSPGVVCSPPSGSTFPVGTTTVTCTATDACGNTSECTFDVTVTGTNLISVEVELQGVNTPVVRCIHFMADVCSSTTDEPLAFTDHDFDGGLVTPVRATALIEVPCGTFAAVCAKDRQHTLWDSVPLVPSFDLTQWEGTGVLTLDGGDTDDDADVDINDVTWFLAQFGGLAADGGCPYDGTTRDADFSNNGAVASEDYSFLVDNWLTASSCACAFTWVPGPGAPPVVSVDVRTGLHRAADLSGDGRVDADDVELFEIRHGLPGQLSAVMRASAKR